MAAKTAKKIQNPGPVWLADPDDLYLIEQEVACRELGISMADKDQLEERSMSMLALAAVLIARRDDRTIPLDRYKTLRLKDLTFPEREDQEQGEPGQAPDPT